MDLKEDKILYKYLRGSWCHGIGVEGKSDYDYSGVFLCPEDTLYGLRGYYKEQISDAKGDEVYYELGRWFELLLKSNPTVLEGLYINKEFVIGETHPAIQKIIDNRDIFLTKEVYSPLLGYSFQQIKKATGYNKKCNYPENMQRKSVLDFCYVPYGQGSKKVSDWLADYGMKQKYCGLVLLPNMHDTYGLYYDWGTHLICEYNADIKDKTNLKEVWGKICREYDFEEYYELNKGSFYTTLECYYFDNHFEDYFSQLKQIMPYGFSGIVSENNDSNEVRTCSVPKNILPITYMTYNKSGYESYCRDYKEWTEWKKNRNPIRFSDNKGYNFDAKNMCEAIRLIHTGIELAKGEGFNVKRTWDRNFLLDIKNHKISYEEIMEYATDKEREFHELVNSSILPDKIDYNAANKLLVDCRKELYQSI